MGTKQTKRKVPKRKTQEGHAQPRVSFHGQIYYLVGEYFRLSSVERDLKKALRAGYKTKLVKFHELRLLGPIGPPIGPATYLLYTHPKYTGS